LLAAQADEVWKFSEQEDGKLRLAEEKAPLKALPKALAAAR
jgi:hypothetical protein